MKYNPEWNKTLSKYMLPGIVILCVTLLFGFAVVKHEPYDRYKVHAGYLNFWEDLELEAGHYADSNGDRLSTELEIAAYVKKWLRVNEFHIIHNDQTIYDSNNKALTAKEASFFLETPRIE